MSCTVRVSHGHERLQLPQPPPITSNHASSKHKDCLQQHIHSFTFTIKSTTKQFSSSNWKHSSNVDIPSHLQKFLLLRHKSNQWHGHHRNLAHHSNPSTRSSVTSWNLIAHSCSIPTFTCPLCVSCSLSTDCVWRQATSALKLLLNSWYPTTTSLKKTRVSQI